MAAITGFFGLYEAFIATKLIELLGRAFCSHFCIDDVGT